MAGAARERETRLGFSLPLRRWREIEGISNTRAYELLSTGEIDSILLGLRRIVILESWRDYLGRQQRGEERDPAAKLAAARRFAETAEKSRQRYAPKHGTASRIGASAPGKPLKTRGTRRSDTPSRPAEARAATPVEK